MQNKLIADLRALEVQDRINTVYKDIQSRKDLYREIEPHLLAELLGIYDADNPGSDWLKMKIAERQIIERAISDNPENFLLIERLVDKVSPDRQKILENLLETFEDTNTGNLSLLLPEEVEILERFKQEDVLYYSVNVIAQFSIKTENGSIMKFEGFIEDDGACIHLLTPYDERDGRFFNLTDCLIEYF